MNSIDPIQPDKKSSQKRIFKIITLIFPVLLILLIEGVLRLVSAGDNLNLFVKHPLNSYREYVIVNPSIGKKYFQKFEHDAPSNDIFLKEKPENTIRVFVMGSSTVVGFPYEKNLMFSRILGTVLQKAYPGKEVELINTAITAVNSYTLYDYSKEIVKFKPDAVLIYAGHNEFYGAFGAASNESMSRSIFFTRLHLKLLDFRLYQVLRNLTGSIQGKLGSGNSDEVHGTLMKRIVANKDIDLNSDIYKKTISSYEKNMGDLLKRFVEEDIAVFLSEVVSNVKDVKPLSSTSTDTINKAAIQYQKAIKAFEEGDSLLAKELFYKAKDLDGIRFRASEDINRIIHRLAKEYQVHKVPMLKYFQDASPQSLIGSNLMTEHVHPNVSGNFLMAEAFHNEIIAAEIFGPIDSSYSFNGDYLIKNWGYSSLDIYLARHRVSNLMSHWPFRPVNSGQSDYRLTYKPLNSLDALAFEIFKNPEIEMAEKRLELAKTYHERAQYIEAFNEYNALVYTNPYLAINFRDAASELLLLQDLPLALEYFKRSQFYEKSFYASYRLGEIYIMKGDFTSARKSFEEAFKLADNDEDKIKTLGKIYQACIYAREDEDAEELADQLKKYAATSYLNIPAKTYVYMNYVPYKTRDQIEQAQGHIQEGKVDKALASLEASLDIYDSHIAHRLLAELYLQKEDLVKAGYHFNKVYKEFSFDPNFLEDMVLFYKLCGDDEKEEETLEKLKRIK